MASLREVYLGERPDAAGADDLEDRLEALVRAAQDDLPGITVGAEELAAALAGLPEPADAVPRERAVELALALACARGDRAALDHFSAHYLSAVDDALRAMKLDDDLRGEVKQEVLHKLLVAEGARPKLVGYAGRGSLRGLLKVTATRTAISILRKRGREAPGDEALDDVPGDPDPELAFLKERYRAVFRAAFEEAVMALEPRERNLLRLHFLRKVTLDALATMYGVHRATIVRQLAKIRDELDRGTRRGLRDRLAADGREVESVMDLVRSRFDVSVERLLRTME